jgi:uncharacterized protein YcbK (DUF882 family)
MGESDGTAGHKVALYPRLRRFVWGATAAGLLVGGIYMLPAADAGGETRTMTLYSVNTKEKLTTTYMVNGRHVASELKKINHLLRDWRRNAVTNMDTETIDLMWELHADLGSKAPIHIISGYRSSETNAMLKNVGRNVAKKSMHIQGKAIDLYFPDVPTERLRNSALVRDIGGVGYYPRSGASGFVHVDSGRVRHWPGIGSSQLAKIRQDYRKTIGARLSGDRAVQMAAAEKPSPAEPGYPTPTPRPRPIEVLMMAAAQMTVEPMTVEPVSAPAPVRNFAETAARDLDTPQTMPKEDPRRDLALARLTIEPVAAPVPKHNFAAPASPVRDTLATELEPEFKTDLVVARIPERPLSRAHDVERASANAATSGAEGFLTALRDGIAAGAQQLMRGAESLLWSDEASQYADAGRKSAPLEAAREPFPPITEEDAAELEMIIAALRSRADYDAQSARAPSAKGDRLSLIRARKGDLILSAPPPRNIGNEPIEASAAIADQPVNLVAVQTFEKLLKASQSVE